MTEENGAPTLGTQNQAVEFILAEPERRRRVAEWAAAAPIEEATTAPPRRDSRRTRCTSRYAPRMERIMAPPVFATAAKAGGLTGPERRGSAEPMGRGSMIGAVAVQIGRDRRSYSADRVLGGPLAVPSFDIVSRLDLAEVDNAIAGINREIATRFDFKGSKCIVERKEGEIDLVADDELKLKQLHELLKVHLTRRKIEPVRRLPETREGVR